MHEYRIMVHNTPSYHDNPKEPYFWCILEFMKNTGGLVNVGCGWAETIDKAFNAAKRKIKELEQKERDNRT